MQLCKSWPNGLAGIRGEMPINPVPLTAATLNLDGRGDPG